MQPINMNNHGLIICVAKIPTPRLQARVAQNIVSKLFALDDVQLKVKLNMNFSYSMYIPLGSRLLNYDLV